MIKSLKQAKFLCLLLILISFFVVGGKTHADIQGQNQVFNVNETFDKLSRKSMPATLRYISDNSYFYVEDSYWNDLGFVERDNLLLGMKQLANDFDTNIYPKETSFWGQEPKPGVDNDNHIVILLEQLKSGHGGYFSTSNGYLKSEVSGSNEREMIVVNAESVSSPYSKAFLAHEFQHLISFNQKEMLRNVGEDIWMNELRSEYSVTLAGYNNNFYDSNLERRTETFFGGPSDSLTEWPNVSLDYSLVALFGEYIVEELGENFLKETLQNNLAGILSFNNVLSGRGAKERFIDIFSGWLAASYINNKSINLQFGYARPELKNFKAAPQRLTILSGSESNIFDYSLKPWQPYGHKFLVSGSLSVNKAIKLAPAYNSKFAYADNLGRFSIMDKDFYVTDSTETRLPRPGSAQVPLGERTGPSPGGDLQYFFIFPINDKKVSDFGIKEDESVLTLTVAFEEKALGVDFGLVLKDGVLIKKARESEIYVIEGKYKRYLRSEIIALYGHLDAAKAVEVNDAVFNSYITSNYTRYIDDEKTYAIWPDGTKHWLNITPQQWDASGRDWGAVFIINDLELNTYKTGVDIKR